MQFAAIDPEFLKSWAKLLLGMNLLDAITLGVVAYGWWKVFNGRPLRVITRGRRRSLEPLGVRESDIKERVALLGRGLSPTPAQELSWLSGALSAQWDAAVTFADPDQRQAIAEAYEEYAARLETGALLGANHSPLVLSEARRARAVSRLARDYARLSRSIQSDEEEGAVARELRLEIPHRGLALTMSGAGKERQGALHAHHLMVSYRDSRLFVDPRTRRDERDVRLPVSVEEKKALEKYFANPHRFDGALPRLVGWAAESDIPSGRPTLHLSIAETTFAAVVADHYATELRGDGHDSKVEAHRQIDGNRVRVLTLSAVLVTRCGHLIFVKRSKLAGSHQGQFGPAANGNLEFDPRPGLDSDFGPDGLPDPRRALAREMREEIGVQADPQDFIVTGLGHFDSPTERGTYVLLGVCFVDLDRDMVLQAMRRSDPIEGHWETEETLIALRIPRNAKERTSAIDWLVNERQLTPHATMVGLGALVVALRTDSFLTDVAAAVRPRGSGIRLKPRVRDMVAECHAGGNWHALPRHGSR